MYKVILFNENDVKIHERWLVAIDLCQAWIRGREVADQYDECISLSIDEK